jgi:spermidine synthase
LSTYAGRYTDLKPWLAGAHVNTDLDLRLQYLAGMGLNYNNADAIKREIARYAQYPGGLFTGSPDLLRQVQFAAAPR